MTLNYSLSPRLLAFILFLSLFIQSCSNSFNPSSAKEKEIGEKEDGFPFKSVSQEEQKVNTSQFLVPSPFFNLFEQASVKEKEIGKKEDGFPFKSVSQEEQRDKIPSFSFGSPCNFLGTELPVPTSAKEKEESFPFKVVNQDKPSDATSLPLAFTANVF